MSKKIRFFKEAVKNYKTSGTVVPSSRFLTKRIINNIDFKNAKVIVELGPGNGVFTKKILAKLQPNAILICFEINDVFYSDLKKIDHPQLKVLKTSAENIQEELKKLNIDKADYIVSSLPLAILPKEITSNILNKCFSALTKNGLFIQFQYSLTYYSKLKEVFGENIKLDFEPLNFPPAFVYKCVKK